MRKCKINRDEGEYEYCAGTGKRVFVTKGAAERAVADIKRKRKGEGSVYVCKQCGHFHVTSIGYRESHARMTEPTPGLGLEGNFETHGAEVARIRMKSLERMHRLNLTPRTLDAWWAEMPLWARLTVYEVVEGKVGQQ